MVSGVSERVTTHCGYNRACWVRVAAAVMAGLLAHNVLAVGTPAQTALTNQAPVDYVIGGVPLTEISNPTLDPVDEFLDLVVATVTPTTPVTQPDTDRVLAFTVTNVGNGTEAVLLSATNVVGPDDFDAINVRIFIDDDGTPGFSLGDSLFNAGAPPVLDTNTPGQASITAFIVADIPTPLANGERATLTLTAVSVTQINPGTPATSEPLGTIGTAAGDGGVDLVVGDPADDSASGDYIVTVADVQISKSAVVVSDPLGAVPPNLIPGSVIRYALQIDVVGAGTVDNLVITDDIPNDVTYNTASIVLDGVPQTDAPPPGDAGEFVPLPAGTNGTGQVVVDLGSGIAGGVNFNITFDVTVD